MKFRGNYKDIQFEMKLIKEDGIHFIHKSYELDESDYKDFKLGDMAIYSIMIDSELKGERLLHYLPGRPLATDKEELLEELDLLIEEEGILEELERIWTQVLDKGQDPSWKK